MSIGQNKERGGDEGPLLSSSESFNLKASEDMQRILSDWGRAFAPGQRRVSEDQKGAFIQALEMGADPNAMTIWPVVGSPISALCVVLQLGEPGLARAVLKAGGAGDARGLFDQPAIIVATRLALGNDMGHIKGLDKEGREESFKTVEALLRAGADPGQANGAGQSAWSVVAYEMESEAQMAGALATLFFNHSKNGKKASMDAAKWARGHGRSRFEELARAHWERVEIDGVLGVSPALARPRL